MKRAGLSLMEVVIALSILVGSAAVLGQLMALGEKQSERADELTQTQRIAFNKMNEILSGIAPMEPVEQQPVRIDSDWSYSVTMEPVGTARLLKLTVSVYEYSEEPSPVEDTEAPIRPAFQLTRWIRSDSYLVDSNLLDTEDEENEILFGSPAPPNSRTP